MRSNRCARGHAPAPSRAGVGNDRGGTPSFSTRDKDTPVTFLLGGNQVIAGLEEGVTGMRVGERRLLIVPPSLSKRTSYPASTPKDSTLRIDLELIAVGK